VERESSVGFELPAVDTISQDLKDDHKEVESSAKAIDLLSVKSVQVVQVSRQGSQRATKAQGVNLEEAAQWKKEPQKVELRYQCKVSLAALEVRQAQKVFTAMFSRQCHE